jgi:TetR/AcrR family transcriptional regulator, transcriptional repressor for nem operon
MDTREHILTSAKRLVQQRGFNGFSYADIADEVGIRKASLHHHFPTKADLGRALIENYASVFSQALEDIGRSRKSSDKKLAAYVALYRQSFDANRMCLCGMLASEVLTLDASLLPPLKRFFDENAHWLTEVLATGKSNWELTFLGAAAVQAQLFLSTLQGSLLIARATGSAEVFDLAANSLISNLKRPS